MAAETMCKSGGECKVVVLVLMPLAEHVLGAGTSGRADPTVGSPTALRGMLVDI